MPTHRAPTPFAASGRTVERGVTAAPVLAVLAALGWIAGMVCTPVEWPMQVPRSTGAPPGGAHPRPKGAPRPTGCRRRAPKGTASEPPPGGAEPSAGRGDAEAYACPPQPLDQRVAHRHRRRDLP
ncbi:morphogenic membrane protein MmpA [Streptomyces composti]|uniref:morphogenic membrane protein MmpA n=1 Tax=Streptomyces composti TaxID=2720025 RepID=UPI00359CAB03